MPRPFRFGLSARSPVSRAAWQRTARQAEAIGFDTLLVADHLVDMLPPLVSLASAAEATERLRVGTLVVNNDFRHPVVLAREAAALGMLTEGRFELGLGAGHMKPEYDQAGIRFDRAGVRVERLDESVAIIRKLLDGHDVTHHGKHFRVTGHRAWPVLDPAHRVPILVGGNGRRVLSIAARRADTVGFVGFAHTPDASGLVFPNFSAAGLDRHICWVREQAGDRFDALELNALIQVVEVTADRRSAAQQLHDRWGDLAVDELLDSPFLLLGTYEQMADQLRERRERFGISYWVTFASRPHSTQDAATLGPVIERVSGS